MFDLATYREKCALVSSAGRRVTYGELEGISEEIASHIETRRLVFQLCCTNIGSIAGYVAFMNNNDVTLLLDAHIEKHSFDSLIEAYHPDYLWVPADCELIEDAEKVYETEGYVLWKTGKKGATQMAEELALLLATSGSLGSPKVVRLTKENLRSNAQSIIEYLGITESEKPILGLPMNYAYGLSIINSHLMAGATLLLSEWSFVEREFWRFAVENGFTSYSGVPYTYEVIKKMKIWMQEMPTLRTLTQAGGMLNKEIVRFFDETFLPRGVRFFVMYGQAEATARISYLEPKCIKAKLGSIGKAIPGGRLSIKDDNDNEINDCNTIGEIVYSGANVSMGYADCAEDLMKGDENKGVVHTGDLGYFDADGYYYITGRKGRFVKLFGHRLSLDYAERLLQPILGECACIGDDSHMTVFITNQEIEDNKVIDVLSSRTRIPKKAFSVCRIDVMPRNESGKVMYERLRQSERIK